MTHQYKLLINGELTPGASQFDVVNPATGEAFAKCPKADADQLEAAVKAAKTAFKSWSARPVDERAAMVDKLADALHARGDEFARLLTTEQGKPLDQAMYEIMGAVFTLKAF
ncbi:MAG: aldehyde dehydrogenase family protein, partial [Oricola sp.]|nr:aldehyde dehydrogenase family protein [Oricola sp.]